MNITITHQTTPATYYPWHWQITAQCGKVLADGYEASEQDALDVSRVTANALRNEGGKWSDASERINDQMTALNLLTEFES
jgi:hypothetical protein